jgi:hypothetical protein
LINDSRKANIESGKAEKAGACNRAVTQINNTNIGIIFQVAVFLF